MKFSDTFAKDASRNAASSKTRVTKYLGTKANGRVHVYHAEQIDENGDVVAEGELQAWDLPPAQLEIVDESGLLAADYRISGDQGWILAGDRGAGIRNPGGLKRKE